MKISNLKLKPKALFGLLAGLVLLTVAVGVVTAYETMGYLESADFFTVAGLSNPNKIEYSATIPAGASLKIQFSYGENMGWYSAGGVRNAWTTLSAGDNAIDLTALDWHKDQFYYRLWFTSDDGSATPTLDSVTLSYIASDGTYYTYNSDGILTSSNLLPAEGVGDINSFGYTVYSIPTGTSLKLQFSQNNSTWYNSAGALDGYDTLSISSATTTLDLTGLGWSGGSFFYRAVFATTGEFTPVLTSVVVNYDPVVNVAPDAPTLVSPADEAVVTDNTPTLSALYSDPDADDTGTTSYRVASTSASDCLTGESLVASGTSTETVTNSATTTYTPGTSLGADGVYYWCAQNNDGATTSAWTTMGSFTLDTTAPVASNFAPVVGAEIETGDSITFVLDEAGECRLSLDGAESYAEMSDDTSCTVANGIQITCTVPELGEAGDKTLYFACVDDYENADTAETATAVAYVKAVVAVAVAGVSSSGGSGYVFPTLAGLGEVAINDGRATAPARLTTLALTPPKGLSPTAVIIADNPDFAGASFLPYADQLNFDLCFGRADCADGSYTVYVKFLDASGRATQAFAHSVKLNAVPLSAEALARMKQLFAVLFPSAPVINFPPLADSVSEQAPPALSGVWDLTSPRPLGQTALANLPRDFVALANKFPVVREALQKIGLNQPIDADRLKTAQLSLPGLSQTLGLTEGARVAVADLSRAEVSLVPTGVVFARGAGGAVDLTAKLSLSNQGLALQTVKAVQGQALNLVYKPEAPAQRIVGYLLFKSNQRASKPKLNPSLLTASVAQAAGPEDSPLGSHSLPTGRQEGLSSKQEEETDLLLAKFEYRETANGLWSADVSAPLVLGQYELRTVVEYADRARPTDESSMVVIVDPEGYVYEKLRDGREVRVTGATVSIYWLNASSTNYELWPAQDFRQINPQTTDVTGRYAFLVPPGDYYLSATADGYREYRSDPFKVEENKGVFMNLELRPKFGLKLLDPQTILLGLILLTLIYLAVRRNKPRPTI